MSWAGERLTNPPKKKTTPDAPDWNNGSRDPALPHKGFTGLSSSLLATSGIAKAQSLLRSRITPHFKRGLILTKSFFACSK
jgi:hypothetical protein